MHRFLESHHLRLIAQVARTESVTRAADLLNVTQSAVSHQLREIEDKLGTPLFVRSGRRMLLTPAGRLLVEAADEVLRAIARVESQVGQIARHAAGELRVCTNATPATHGCQPSSPGCVSRYPRSACRSSPSTPSTRSPRCSTRSSISR